MPAHAPSVHSWHGASTCVPNELCPLVWIKPQAPFGQLSVCRSPPDHAVRSSPRPQVRDVLLGAPSMLLRLILRMHRERPNRIWHPCDSYGALPPRRLRYAPRRLVCKTMASSDKPSRSAAELWRT